MSNSEELSEVKRILRKRGFTGDMEPDPDLKEGEALDKEEIEDDDPLQAIDLSTYTEDQIERYAIPEEMVGDLKPAEKQRVLRDPEPPSAVLPPKDPWVRTIPSLGDVTVSEEEREEYLRALLKEERFEIPLHMTIGKNTPFVVRMRSLFASEREVIALAVEKLVKDYPIRSLVENKDGPLQNMAVATDYYLRIRTMVQVVRIDDKVQIAYDARTEPGELPENSPKVAELAGLVRTHFENMHQAKYKLLMQAAYLFETKQLILEDAMINRDFWKPEDTN